MNANRVTAKYYKFYHIPQELKNYDYVLHIDAARLKYLSKLSPDKIYSIYKKKILMYLFLEGSIPL